MSVNIMGMVVSEDGFVTDPGNPCDGQEFIGLQGAWQTVCWHITKLVRALAVEKSRREEEFALMDRKRQEMERERDEARAELAEWTSKASLASKKNLLETVAALVTRCDKAEAACAQMRQALMAIRDDRDDRVSPGVKEQARAILDRARALLKESDGG